MLGIHVDYFAATSFGGFVNLVDAMRGVRISLVKPVVDPFYQVPSGGFGVRFPAGPQTLLGKRALIFTRTRQGDNDFERERRHQLFLLAAGRELLAHPALVEALLTVKGNLITDFPVGEVAGLVNALASSASWPVQQVVLGPTQYEYNVPCACGYALQPRLGQMRATARRFFPWAVTP
jgi:anionic cell wall polymer biosynthesis LytR-Cps2A-Psr (LCP) family protein